MKYFPKALMVLSFLVGTAADAQVRCTHSSGGNFLCFDADGRTPVAVPHEYRKPVLPMVAEDRAALEPEKTGAAPAGKSGAGTAAQPIVSINRGAEAAPAPASGAPRTCSWEAGKGVTCQ